MLLHLLALGVIPVVQGFLDLELEVLEIAHVGLDLVQGQLDEHTSNLGCLLVADKLLHVRVDAVPNLVLQVRVLRKDSWDQSHRVVLVSLRNRHLSGVHSSWILHWHWLLLRLHWHWLRLHHSLLGVWHLLLAWLHHLVWWLLLLLLGSWVHLLVHWSTVWTSAWSSWASVVVVSWSLILVLIHLVGGSLIHVNHVEKLLEHLSQVRLGSQVIPLESTSLLSLVLLPISLVLGGFHVELSDLLDLIVVDDEHLSFAVVILQTRFCFGGISWLLVANESIGIARLSFVTNLDLLDLSEWAEEVLQVIFTPALGEVLDKQVASLLGCLVSDGVALFFSLALSWFQSWADSELDTWCDLAIVHLEDSLLSALGSVLLILTLGIGVANKGELELLNLVGLTKFQRADVSERLEHLGDFLISLFDWDVFDVDVVDDLSEISLVLWLVLEGFNFTDLARCDSLLGGGLLLEADEAIAS